MYTIKQAALRSGVNVALLRAWERRYGVVAPIRTDSGYRLYDDEAISRLQAMRGLVDGGWSPRQAAEHVAAARPDELHALAKQSAPEDGPSTDPVAAFVEGATRIDSRAIERALDDMFASGSFERVVEERLYPALAALGDAWADGRVDVAGEHAAAAAVLRRLGMAFEAAGSASRADRPILVGLPPDARHEVAALAFATAARRAGLSVSYLGADVPAASWIEAVRLTGARAVVLGVALEQDVTAAEQVVTALGGSASEVVIAVGGRRSESVRNGAVVRLPNTLSAAVETLRATLD
ncbi:MAG: MerR family transcriptional regulator [Chloroflexi bacterium]|nr:MerR family transcriptional regulator [Chloroflexota bacterium]